MNSNGIWYDELAESLRAFLGEASGYINRRDMLQRHCICCNDAVERLVDACYEMVDGQPVNVDPYTYRLLIHTPWPRRHYRDWELTRKEASVLRWHNNMLHAIPGKFCVYGYCSRRRSWFLLADRYPTAEAAHDAVRATRLTGGRVASERRLSFRGVPPSVLGCPKRCSHSTEFAFFTVGDQIEGSGILPLIHGAVKHFAT